MQKRVPTGKIFMSCEFSVCVLVHFVELESLEEASQMQIHVSNKFLLFDSSS